jgi:signal transduction histidine kinase
VIGSGMKSEVPLARRVIVASAIALLSIVGLGVMQFRSALRFAEETHLVSHAQDVLRELQSTRTRLNEAQSAADSFLITGDSVYLKPFAQSAARITEHLRTLRKLSTDSAVQQRRLDKLEPQVRNILRALQEQVDSRRSNAATAGAGPPLPVSLRGAFDDARLLIAWMERDELELLREGNALAESTNQQTNSFIFFSTLVAFMLLAASGIALYFDVLARHKSDKTLRRANETLRQEVLQRQQVEESLRSLSARLLQLQDEERRRLARELHDSAGQSLVGLRMNLAPLEAEASRLSPRATKALKDSGALVDDLSSELRTISYLLHPPLLDEAGLVSALRMFLDGLAERSRIKVHFEIPQDFGRLSQDLETAIFRIVQECLTNIHRHSGSQVASVRISRDDSQVRIKVADKGKGITPERRQAMESAGTPGVGIRGMRERVRQLGGSLEIRSEGPGEGTAVTVGLPVAATAESSQGSSEVSRLSLCKPDIAQIAYDETFSARRADFLQGYGYRVLSLRGNDEAKRILNETHANHVFIVGHAASLETREELVRWLKGKFPCAKVLALNAPAQAELPEADHNFSVNSPDQWLTAI